jgi:CDP-diacylglycerol--serine O-phosphatidyltransferase
VRFLGIQRPGAADVMTLGNVCCGAAAILVVVIFAGRGESDLAHTGLRVVALLLLAGTIFDSLDGAFARRGGGTSLGAMLDSLADAVTFGVAPAVLLVELGLRDASGPEQVLLVIGFLVYVSGAVLRLADFSSVRHAETRFTGLPSPLAAMLLLSLAFLTGAPVVIALGLAGAGLMMVSRLAYPLQRGPVVAAAGFGWVFCIAGTLGLYDVRIPAAVGLCAIVGMPMVASLVLHHREPRSAVL